MAGRVGGLPPTIPVRVFATDLDTGRKQALVTNVADETAVDQPFGMSIISLVAPLAVEQAAGDGARRLARAPHRPRLLPDRVPRAQAAPARFCNRYVSDVTDPLGAGNVVAAAAATTCSPRSR